MKDIQIITSSLENLVINKDQVKNTESKNIESFSF